jgi:hypothetical protein
MKGEQTLWVVEIEVGRKPSHLDELVRGRQPFGVIKGGLTTREPITEEYLSVGKQRDEAIDFFRKATGWSGAVSLRLVRSRHEAASILDTISRGRGLRLRYSDPGSIEEIETAMGKI